MHIKDTVPTTMEITMPDIAVQAPTFTLHSSAFKEVSLESFRGKKNVVLVFFPAVFTGVCTKEMCSFDNALNQFNDKDTQVLGLTVDGPHPTGEFVKQNNISFPILCDVHKEVIKKYDAVFDNFGIPGYSVATRSVFVIDKLGTLRWKWYAPNPGVEPNYDDVLAAIPIL